VREVDTWTQALFVTPPLMSGVPLRPFSLSHSVLLRAIENPYAYIGLHATRAELMAAVLVCSRTCEQNRMALFGGAQRQGPLVRWSWRWRRMDLAIADASFRQYVTEHTRTPQFAEAAPDDDAPAIVAPVEWHLHRHLCVDRGWDDAAAWDCGFSYACHLAAVWKESQGGGGLKSEYDREMERLDGLMSAAHARGDGAERDRIFQEMGAYMAKHGKGARRGRA